ncbi:hypothetical protein J6590_039335 [Homalodisca vitripennis]|nr:hypothetical protein J6590_039335 [Homalodisca vitripennis]
MHSNNRKHLECTEIYRKRAYREFCVKYGKPDFLNRTRNNLLTSGLLFVNSVVAVGPSGTSGELSNKDNRLRDIAQFSDAPADSMGNPRVAGHRYYIVPLPEIAPRQLGSISVRLRETRTCWNTVKNALLKAACVVTMGSVVMFGVMFMKSTVEQLDQQFLLPYILTIPNGSEKTTN